MKSPSYCSLLFAIVVLITANNCLGQKDNNLLQDIDLPKISKVPIPIKMAKFQSNETARARADYQAIAKPGQISNLAIAMLRKKGHSNGAILATIRQVKVQAPASSTISNTDIAEDVKLMLKAMPTLSAAEIITSILELYDVSTIRLFDIAVLTSQDDSQLVEGSKSFTYYCDGKIINIENVSNSTPYRKGITKLFTAFRHYKKLYPWQCFEYWNTGLRSVILPETNLNEFLRLMRASAYPLYRGLTSADLADSSVNFSVIMGTTAEALKELMECTTLAYLPPVSGACDIEVPYPTNQSFTGDGGYAWSCFHSNVIRRVFYLKDVLNVLKRNGISVTTLATAAKTRFNPTDDDLKQRIISSFDLAVFTTSEILQASNVVNSD